MYEEWAIIIIIVIIIVIIISNSQTFWEDCFDQKGPKLLKLCAWW